MSRLNRLKEAREKLLAKIKAQPKDPRSKAWLGRVSEYEQSISNIEKLGIERPREGTTGVEINVPKGD